MTNNVTPDRFIIESCGSLIAYRDTLADALDFAKHYSDKGTMMGVQVWQELSPVPAPLPNGARILPRLPRLGHVGSRVVPRKYVCSFVDGRRWDNATAEVL